MTKEEIEARAYDAYERHILRGEHLSAIAKDYGVGVTTIFNDTRRVAEELRANHLAEITLKRTNLTSRWEKIYFEAMAGFERSKQAEVTTTQEDIPAKTPDGIPQQKVKRQEKSTTGESRFLSIAGQACDSILKIWGVDIAAAEKTGAEPRAAGLTQLQLVQKRLKELRKTEDSLRTGLAGLGGDGDRA